MNSGINIVFYSRECETCKNLLTLLQNENLISYFKLFCVDDRLNELPVIVTVVPTMIVSNVNKPLIAKEIFEWVQQTKFLRQKMMNNRGNRSNLNQEERELLGFVSQEMGGLSDGFAYTKIDKPLPHSYFNLGEEEKNAIFTAPETKKINKQDQDSMIKKLENDRGDQDKKYSSNMKHQQIQAVMNSENENLNGSNGNMDSQQDQMMNMQRMHQNSYQDKMQQHQMQQQQMMNYMMNNRQN